MINSHRKTVGNSPQLKLNSLPPVQENTPLDGLKETRRTMRLRLAAQQLMTMRHSPHMTAQSLAFLMEINNR